MRLKILVLHLFCAGYVCMASAQKPAGESPQLPNDHVVVQKHDAKISLEKSLQIALPSDSELRAILANGKRGQNQVVLKFENIVPPKEANLGLKVTVEGRDSSSMSASPVTSAEPLFFGAYGGQGDFTSGYAKKNHPVDLTQSVVDLLSKSSKKDGGAKFLSVKVEAVPLNEEAKKNQSGGVISVDSTSVVTKVNSAQ